MTDKEEREKTDALRAKYPCIVRWGRELLSYDYYINNQVWEADADNAPTDAIYKGQDGKWSLARDIKSPELRERILGDIEP